MTDSTKNTEENNVLNLFANTEALQAEMESIELSCDRNKEILTVLYSYIELTRTRLIKLLGEKPEIAESWFKAERYQEFITTLRIIESSSIGIRDHIKTQMKKIDDDIRRAKPEDRIKLEEKFDQLLRALYSFENLSKRVFQVSETTKRDVLRTLDYKDELVDVSFVEDGGFVNEDLMLPSFIAIPDIPDLKQRLIVERDLTKKEQFRIEDAAEVYAEELKPLFDDFERNRHMLAELPEEAQDLIKSVFVNANKEAIFKALIRDKYVDLYQLWRDLVRDGCVSAEFSYFQKACYEVAKIVYEYVNIFPQVPDELENKVEAANALYAENWPRANQLASEIEETFNVRPVAQIDKLRKYAKSGSPLFQPDDSEIEIVLSYSDALKNSLILFPFAVNRAGIHLSSFEKLTETPREKGSMYYYKENASKLYEGVYDLSFKARHELLNIQILLDKCAQEIAMSDFADELFKSTLQTIIDDPDEE